jgi:phospholipid transport system substrate-binding protein
MMLRRSVLLALSALPLAALPLAVLPRQALAESVGGGAAGSSASDPAVAVGRLNDALLQTMRDGTTTPFPQRFQALAPVIEQVFDLAAILRTSVGLRWDQIPPAQQQTLMQVFRQFTTASYAANFDHFDGQRFELLPDRRSVGSDVVIATRYVQRDDSTRIDYVMHPADGGWKAVDVLLDGAISRVAVQRSDFRSLLNTGNAEALIHSLQDKVAQLSGGTITA